MSLTHSNNRQAASPRLHSWTPVNLFKELASVPERPQRIISPDQAYNIFAQRRDEKYHNHLPLLTQLFFVIVSWMHLNSWGRFYEYPTARRLHRLPMKRCRQRTRSTSSMPQILWLGSRTLTYTSTGVLYRTGRPSQGRGARAASKQHKHG